MGRGLLDGLADGFGNLASLFSGCLIGPVVGLLAAALIALIA
ncbi:MAG: hypothetical protein R6X16_06755 [Anaerolineae bacterium]